VIAANKGRLAAPAAVHGGGRHTPHNRRTQHNNRSKCETHLLRYNSVLAHPSNHVRNNTGWAWEVFEQNISATRREPLAGRGGGFGGWSCTNAHGRRVGRFLNPCA
jgi:hypothetical protein